MQMSRDDIHNAILNYLDIIENDKGSSEANIRALETSLDMLALARKFIDFQFDDTTYPDAPIGDYDRLRQLATERFPEFGFYNMPSSITQQIGEAEMCIGDALDDVADIARDLHEVAWCWANTSIEDALWHFQFGYDSHWGEHLRNLQLYIHAQKNDCD